MVVPTDSAVALPVPETDATAALLEFHVIVAPAIGTSFALRASAAKSRVALKNVSVSTRRPAMITLAWAFVTFTVIESRALPAIALTCVVPTLTAVTVPLSDTVAISGFTLVHATLVRSRAAPRPFRMSTGGVTVSPLLASVMVRGALSTMLAARFATATTVVSTTPVAANPTTFVTPAPTAVTTPVALTVALVGSSDVHVTGAPLSTASSLFFTTAVSVTASPRLVSVTLSGVTAIEAGGLVMASGKSSVAASRWALIDVLPVVSAVMMPAVSTRAMAGSLDVHVIGAPVRSLPRASRARANSLAVSNGANRATDVRPTGSTDVATCVTRIVVTFLAVSPTTRLTVVSEVAARATRLVTPFLSAMIFVVLPAGTMRAMVESSTVHPGVAFVTRVSTVWSCRSRTVAVTVPVSLIDVSTTVSLDSSHLASCALTFTAMVTALVSDRAVIVVEPFDSEIRRPVTASTVATAGLLLVQAKPAFAARIVSAAGSPVGTPSALATSNEVSRKAASWTVGRGAIALAVIPLTQRNADGGVAEPAPLSVAVMRALPRRNTVTDHWPVGGSWDVLTVSTLSDVSV